MKNMLKLDGVPRTQTSRGGTPYGWMILLIYRRESTSRLFCNKSIPLEAERAFCIASFWNESVDHEQSYVVALKNTIFRQLYIIIPYKEKIIYY